MNKKGYNNNEAWETIEKENNQTIVIPTNNIITENSDDFSSDEIDNIINDDIINDTETDNLNISEIEETTEENDESLTESKESNENFSEVLQLTEYTGLSRNENTDFVVAEYDKIDTTNIDKDKFQIAKKFVSKITKFILDFNDVQLTETHKNYIRQVGQLQLDNLRDLLMLVEINKQMINNIVARVNATQAEDYAIITSYNNLINQHIKLIKELTNMYKSIPGVMKKMRADVLSNQELVSNPDTEEVITEEYGETQFNNSKQMLRLILEKRKQKVEEKTNVQD